MESSDEPVPVESWPLSALLRGARSVLGTTTRRALDISGFDDLPPNGPFVLGAIARSAAPLADVIRHLGTSKQTAGQLVDTLVARGYLERHVDPDDRRRLVVNLTDRGRAAAAAVRAAVDGLEAGLERQVGAEKLAIARQVLAGLITVGSSHD